MLNLRADVTKFPVGLRCEEFGQVGVDKIDHSGSPRKYFSGFDSLSEEFIGGAVTEWDWVERDHTLSLRSALNGCFLSIFVKFFRRDPKLNMLAPYSWLVASPLSPHISALHHQDVRGYVVFWADSFFSVYDSEWIEICKGVSSGDSFQLLNCWQPG